MKVKYIPPSTWFRGRRRKGKRNLRVPPTEPASPDAWVAQSPAPEQRFQGPLSMGCVVKSPPIEKWRHTLCHGTYKVGDDGEYLLNAEGEPIVPLTVSVDPCTCGAPVVKDPAHDHNPKAWFCLRTGEKYWMCDCPGYGKDDPYPPGRHAERMHALYPDLVPPPPE